MLYGALLGIGVALAVPIAAFAGALGQGRAASSAMEAIARQPEAARDIRSSLILSLALIESLVIYALLMSLLLMGKLPPVLDALRQMVGQ